MYSTPSAETARFCCCVGTDIEPLAALPGEFLLPPGGGCIDVREAPFLAAGDGITDDTAAIHSALCGETIRRPAGSRISIACASGSTRTATISIVPGRRGGLDVLEAAELRFVAARALWASDAAQRVQALTLAREAMSTHQVQCRL